jgi:signal transduction histidine kinase
MVRLARTLPLPLPIVLGSLGVALSIALLVGWTLLVVQNLSAARSAWLLVVGIGSFAAVMTVLVLFAVFLVRQVLELRRQSRFLDSVTHELKSPLASLRLCLETLARPELGTEQQEELRRMMRDDVERLSNFIDDVLEVSRLGYGRAGHAIEETRLRPLVEEAAEAVRRRYRIDPGTIQVEVPSDFSLTTDRPALEIVLKNLLDNAVKYSVEPIRVEVRAERGPKGRALLEVRDQGIGIERRELKRIFHRFHRASGEEVRARPGTGLGLFVVAELTRSLGGSVEAQSPGPGGGTTVRVLLPGAPEAPAR